jgi:hypothetical protein
LAVVAELRTAKTVCAEGSQRNRGDIRCPWPKPTAAGSKIVVARATAAPDVQRPAAHPSFRSNVASGAR